jgi:hypothetical protein
MHDENDPKMKIGAASVGDRQADGCGSFPIAPHHAFHRSKAGRFLKHRHHRHCRGQVGADGDGETLESMGRAKQFGGRYR